MNMKMKQSFIALLVAAVAGSAASVADNQELLESKVDAINAGRGLQVGGSIRGIAEASYFKTEQNKAGQVRLPDVEKAEFVTADLDFHFRPYENVRANAMLRLYGGMQEYFASAAKSISVEWANVEGSIGKSLYWVVGDFRQEISPLTLYLPGLDIMYEPTVFARQRYMAQKDQLIEGNQRNLQGANIQFRHYFNDAVGELRAQALMARLNRTAVLDLSGAEGNIYPNEKFPGVSQAANMDKWLALGNLELLPLSKNLYVGATGMYIFDDEDSYSYTYRHPKNIVDEPYVREDINPYETDAQKTMVVSGRIGGDIAGIMGNKNLILDLVAEVAMSTDEVYHHTKVPAIDELTGELLTDDEGEQIYLPDIVESENETGLAILATLNAGYKTDLFGVRLTGDFIMNDSAWFNNVAQSPSFFAQRIMNSDIDGNVVKYGVNAPLYSTFDALYHFAPKFSPVATTQGTDDNAFAGGQTESYNIANYNKNSWGTNVYTRSQLALLETLNDPALQMSLPNGLATSNRTGGRAVLTANFKDFVEAQGMFSYLMQTAPIFGFKDVTYTEFGGGAKIDIFKMIGFSKPLEISGSYKHSERASELDEAVIGMGGTGEFKSDFINAGLYVQYLPRLGVTAGLQMVTTEYNEIGANLQGQTAPLLKGTQLQWMVGLDYTIDTHAWLSINFGIANVENEYNTSGLVAQSQATTRPYSISANNLPGYYDVTKDDKGKFTHEFSRTIVEASLNVEF